MGKTYNDFNIKDQTITTKKVKKFNDFDDFADRMINKYCPNPQESTKQQILKQTQSLFDNKNKEQRSILEMILKDMKNQFTHGDDPWTFKARFIDELEKLLLYSPHSDGLIQTKIPSFASQTSKEESKKQHLVKPNDYDDEFTITHIDLSNYSKKTPKRSTAIPSKHPITKQICKVTKTQRSEILRRMKHQKEIDRISERISEFSIKEESKNENNSKIKVFFFLRETFNSKLKEMADDIFQQYCTQTMASRKVIKIELYDSNNFSLMIGKLYYEGPDEIPSFKLQSSLFTDEFGTYLKSQIFGGNIVVPNFIQQENKIKEISFLFQ